MKELIEAVEAYQSAVKAYYSETPSPETVADKCVDLVLADEKLTALIKKLKH